MICGCCVRPIILVTTVSALSILLVPWTTLMLVVLAAFPQLSELHNIKQDVNIDKYHTMDEVGTNTDKEGF